MSNLINHAKMEFRAAGWTDDQGNFQDEMQGSICGHILKLLEAFSEEGHSGSSAAYAIGMFQRLANFDPIVPLTGEDWEWTEVADGVFQNKRCGRVFKDASFLDGAPYDMEGRVFWEWARSEDGEKFKTHFTSADSRVPIAFPYTPSREYVFRPNQEFPDE